MGRRPADRGRGLEREEVQEIVARYTRHKELEETGWTEWIWPMMKGYKLKCCDCGLVHTIEFKVVKLDHGHEVMYRAKQNNRSTGQVRRHKK